MLAPPPGASVRSAAHPGEPSYDVLRRALVEGTDIIVEGVHLVPGAHDLPDELEATVVPLVIAVDDEETHRCYLEARASAGRPSDRYIQHLDEIRRIHHEVVRRAQDHGVPQVSPTTPRQTARDALAVVAQRTRVAERTR